MLILWVMYLLEKNTKEENINTHIKFLLMKITNNSQYGNLDCFFKSVN